MLNDWETPPTVEGMIVRAWIGEAGQPDGGRLRERAKSYAKALANDILR